MSTVVLIVLVILLVGALPHYSYSRDWGYYPGGLIGVLLIIMLVLLLTGRL